jgi:hypothetical protein
MSDYACGAPASPVPTLDVQPNAPACRHDSTAACPACLVSAARELVAYSDALAAAEARAHAAWAEGYQAAASASYQRGLADGYAACEADREAEWRAIARPVAHPEAYRREVAARALAAAESGCRRDAAQHEREFVARAYATDRRDRTEVQAACVFVYPPPPGAERARSAA